MNRVCETNYQCLHLLLFLQQLQYQYRLPFHLQFALPAVQWEVTTSMMHQ